MALTLMHSCTYRDHIPCPPNHSKLVRHGVNMRRISHDVWYSVKLIYGCGREKAGDVRLKSRWRGGMSLTSGSGIISGADFTSALARTIRSCVLEQGGPDINRPFLARESRLEFHPHRPWA